MTNIKKDMIEGNSLFAITEENLNLNLSFIPVNSEAINEAPDNKSDKTDLIIRPGTITLSGNDRSVLKYLSEQGIEIEKTYISQCG